MRWVCSYPNMQQVPKDVVELPRNLRVSVDWEGAMRDLILYGTSAYFVTTGPDKPQHIFAGRNDIGDTMTKPRFDHAPPLPGYADAPPITAEQMSNFLYTAIGYGASKKIAELINADNSANLYGQLQTAYVEPKPVYVAPVEDRTHWAKGDVVRCLSRTLSGGGNCEHYGVVGQEYTISEPLSDDGISDVAFEGGGTGARERFTLVRKAPKFLPIDRPVRVPDLEPGDVLRYCGHGQHGPYHSMKQGDEVVVKNVGGGYFSLEQGGGGTWSGKGFSFVRRPGYVKPKRKLGYGEALVKEDRTKWAVGDILRVIEGGRYEHQDKDYFIDGEDYIITHIYKDNGVSDVKVFLYNGNRHDDREKSGSREQFKFVRGYNDLDAWILREHP